MHNCAPKRLPVLLLVLMLGVSPALAQDDSEAQQGRIQAQLQDPGAENSDAEALKEQKEKNDDVREAVLENLDLKELVEESADSSEDSPPGSEQPSQEEGEPSPAEVKAE